MAPGKIAFIDHYDSFSFNVLDWLIRAGVRESDVAYVRCDDRAGLESVKNSKIPLVFSPGPHHPKDIPFSQDLARASLGVVPMLGVCLGHQLFGYISGARVGPAAEPWHGHVEEIKVLSQTAIFAGIPKSFKAASYNSLIIHRDAIAASNEWSILAENRYQEVMAMERIVPGAPAWSVQFHPESFMSEYGAQMAENWLRLLK